MRKITIKILNIGRVNIDEEKLKIESTGCGCCACNIYEEYHTGSTVGSLEEALKKIDEDIETLEKARKEVKERLGDKSG